MANHHPNKEMTQWRMLAGAGTLTSFKITWTIH